MKHIPDDVFTTEFKGNPTRVLLSQGSGNYSVSGKMMNQLWQDRVQINQSHPQFIDYHVMFDHASDNHYIVLRYVAPDGMICSVRSASVIEEEYTLEPSLLNMKPGDERCFSRFGMTFTLKAELE